MGNRRTISIDELGYLEVDDNHRLFWKGEAVILEKRLKLETYQVWLASIAAVGALLAGVHPFLVSFGIL